MWLILSFLFVDLLGQKRGFLKIKCYICPEKCNEMKVIDLINQSERTAFSFEILPPLKGNSIQKVYNVIDKLKEFDPKLASQVQIRSVDSDIHYGASYQDVERRVPSIKEAQTKLNWEPKVNLKDAIRFTLDYHLNGKDPDALLLNK